MDFQLPVQTQSDLFFILTGIALLLFGWLIFSVGTRLFGIGLGAALGFFVGEILNIVLKVDRNAGLYVSIGCSLVFGLGAIFLLKAITNFLFALIGFLIGALLGRIGAEIYADTQGMAFVLNGQSAAIILPTALIMAVLAVWLQRMLMIVVTCYIGATFLNAGVEELSVRWWAFPALLVGGIVWQAGVLRRIVRFSKENDRPASRRKRKSPAGRRRLAREEDLEYDEE